MIILYSKEKNKHSEFLYNDNGLRYSYLFEYSKVLEEIQQQEWHDHIKKLEIDFSAEVNNLTKLDLNHKCFNGDSLLNEMISIVNNVICDYKKDMEEHTNIKPISPNSIRNFLYLARVLHKYKLSASIDADTGFLNAGFVAKDTSFLNVLITDKSEIHYSLVSRGKKIFKISGVVKIKDTMDFKEFNRVMRML